MTVERKSASRLIAHATAAKQSTVDRMDGVVAGGDESISMVQTKEMRATPDPELLAMVPGSYMPMLQTAEVVAKRYSISRERQDGYGLLSQRRTEIGSASCRERVCQYV